MLLLHEVHTVAGRHEDEFEAAFRNGLDERPRRRRRRPAALLPEARARHRTRVPPHDDHRARRRRRVRTARTPRPDRRPAQLGRRRRRHAPRGEGQAAAARSTGRRCASSTSRPCRPTAASTSPCSTWKTARGRTRRSSTRTSRRRGRTTRRASSSAPSGRCSRCSRVFQAALGAPRRREVILWQRVDFPERLPGPVHPRAPGPREGPGHLDARRARSTRRLGEPPPPQRHLVASLTRLRPPALHHGTTSSTVRASGSAPGSHAAATSGPPSRDARRHRPGLRICAWPSCGCAWPLVTARRVGGDVRVVRRRATAPAAIAASPNTRAHGRCGATAARYRPRSAPR